MSTVKVSGHDYVINKLDVFTSYDLTSRLAPICGVLSLSNDKVAMREGFPRAMASLSSSMGADERRAATMIALSAVQRVVHGGVVAPVLNAGGTMQFEDIDVTSMLHLMYEVLLENKIIDFFYVPPSTSTEGTRDASKESSQHTSRTGEAG